MIRASNQRFSLFVLFRFIFQMARRRSENRLSLLAVCRNRASILTRLMGWFGSFGRLDVGLEQGPSFKNLRFLPRLALEASRSFFCPKKLKLSAGGPPPSRLQKPCGVRRPKESRRLMDGWKEGWRDGEGNCSSGM